MTEEERAFEERGETASRPEETPTLSLRVNETLQRCKGLFEGALDVILFIRHDGRIIEANEAAVRAYGYEREELLAISIGELRAVDAAPSISVQLEEAVSQGIRFETTHCRKDGSTFPVEVSSNCVAIGDEPILMSIIRDVSERKRAEKALEESETRYRIVADNTYDWEFWLSPQGQFLYSSPSCEEVTGYTAGEFEANPELISQIIHPEDLPSWRSHRRKAGSAIRTPEELAFRLIRREGGERWIGHICQPIFSAAGEFLGTRGSNRDITERKRTEEALRAAKEYAENLIETANVMVIGLDADGDIRVFNEAAEKITGYTRDELQSKNWFEVLVPKDRYPYVWEIFAGMLAGAPLPRTFENPILTKSSEERYILWRNSELREEGKIVGTISFGVDGTDRKRAEEERERLLTRVEKLAEVAQRRAAELQTILDNMVDGVFVCDVEGRITLANQAGLRLLGLASFEEVKRPVLELLSPLRLRHTDGRGVEADELPLARALRGEVVEIADEVIYNAAIGRDVYVRTSASPIHDAYGKVVGAVEVIRDVTRYVEVDQLKDQFIAVAAHELKTPVTAMKGYAQALLRRPEGSTERKRKGLETIDRQADRIARLVQDLLDISRFQAGPPQFRRERIDLAALAKDFVRKVAPGAPRHRVILQVEEPTLVRGDSERLEQVFRNLVDNAIKYSPEGGEVRVEISKRDGKAVVSVTDQGVGIPREKQEHIFERFYRAHTGTPYDYGGMGVGLFLSREIVRGHGGEMWFGSEEGKGSTFYFTLPAAEGVRTLER